MNRTTAAERPTLKAAVAEVEKLLGYEFRDPSLLTEALTHSSMSNDPANYERLEFVGDAALGLAFSNYLYLTYPDIGPGILTELRAANVSTEKLARVAVRHGLHRLFRRNPDQLDKHVEKFVLAVNKEGESEEELYGLCFGGNTMKAPKVLAHIVESIAAAVYIDCNFNLERLWTAFSNILKPITFDKHPVKAVDDYCRKKGKKSVLSTTKEEDLYTANVAVNGKSLGIGSSEYSDIAELNAARDALKKLGVSGQDVVVVVVGGGPNGGGAMQRLQEMCDEKHWPKPFYRIEEEQGPDRNKKFASSVRVVISNKEYIKFGDLKSGVRDSQHSAAAMMINEINMKNFSISLICKVIVSFFFKLLKLICVFLCILVCVSILMEIVV